MLPTNPPYALAPVNFRFAALAACAGRAPLGGKREAALGAYVAARLVHDVLSPDALPPDLRAERAASARAWLSMLAIPAPIRPALAKLVESTGGELHGMSQALAGVIAVTANFLDPAAHLELSRLATEVQAQTLAT